MAKIDTIQRIRVDLVDHSEVVVRVKQYDKASRTINITCTKDGNTQRIDSSLYRAIVNIKTPSYHDSDYIAIIGTDGTITITLSDNVLHTAGVGKMEVCLYSKTSPESMISSMPIKLIIIGSVYDDTNEIGSDEFSALKDLIAEVTYKETAYEKAENGRVSAENTRVSNENTRKSNETTRQSNETSRQSAENTRVSNENTRKSNETNRQSAETSRVNAEKARVTAESNRVTEFNSLKSASETATAGAEKVNIKSTSGTDSYTITITNRSGTSSTSPNLLNKIGIGTVSTLASTASATASLSGSFGAQKLNLGIPVGKTPSIKIGTVTTGATAGVTISGTAEAPTMNFVLPNEAVIPDSSYMTTAELDALFK